MQMCNASIACVSHFMNISHQTNDDKLTYHTLNHSKFKWNTLLSWSTKQTATTNINVSAPHMHNVYPF